MVEVKTLGEALKGMVRPDLTDDQRWAMLALALQFIAWQLTCDLDKDMSD